MRGSLLALAKSFHYALTISCYADSVTFKGVHHEGTGVHLFKSRVRKRNRQMIYQT